MPIPDPVKTATFRREARECARASLWALVALAALGSVLAWWLASGNGDERRSSKSVLPAVQERGAAEGSAPAPVPVEPAESVARDPRPGERDPARVERPPGHVSFVLREAGTLAGVARFELRGVAGEIVQTFELSAAAPRVELDCPPHEYLLALAPPPPSRLTLPAVRFTLREGERRVVDVALLAAWSLRGVVRDADGAGHAELALTVERDGVSVAATTTRADGSFELAGVAQGDYSLVVGDPQGPLLPRRALRVDRDLALELDLPPLFALEVRVLDWQGQPVVGATVEGKGETGGRVIGATDADGRLAASMLPAGNYRLFASHPALGRGNRIFVLTAGMAPLVEIRLLTGRPR